MIIAPGIWPSASRCAWGLMSTRIAPDATERRAWAGASLVSRARAAARIVVDRQRFWRPAHQSSSALSVPISARPDAVIWYRRMADSGGE
jgi:hypothetical protein